MNGQVTEKQRRAGDPELGGVAPSVAIATRGQDPRALADTERVFQIEDLSVHYGENPAVKDISLDIFHKNITALIGPSGCGKRP